MSPTSSDLKLEAETNKLSSTHFAYPFNSSSEKFSVSRVDTMIARTASAAASSITFLQAIPHAFFQSNVLVPIWLWLGVAVIAVAQLGQLFAAFTRRNMIPWYAALHIATFLGIVLWPLMVQPGQQLTAGDLPWFWWMLAIAGLNAFGAYKPFQASLAVVVLHLAWFLLLQLPVYGGRDIFIAAQDTMLAFFFSTLLGALLVALRQQAFKLDRVIATRIAASIRAASVQAEEAERDRLNALVHDSVLTTLLLAASAKNSAEVEASAALAKSALARIADARAPEKTPDVSVSPFFQALAGSAKSIAADIEVTTTVFSEFTIPGEVAESILEATIQSVTNSVQHAGNQVTSRQLRLSARGNSIKVVVEDDGRGFREARIPRSRLGIRLSVRRRIETVGGSVKINSEPGHGCTVVIMWGEK